MSRILGDNATNKIKLPCSAPTTSDVLKVDPATPGVGVWGKLQDANVDSTRSLVTSSVVDGSKNLDFSAGSGWVNKTLDFLADGLTFGKVTLSALTAGKIDFSKSAGFANKDLDNVGDGTTYKRVTGVNASNLITNTSVDAAAGIAGSKLGAGSGPLTRLDSSGNLDFAGPHTNKTLDSINDGATFKRVAGIDGTGLVTSSSLANGAVSNTKIGRGAVAPAHFSSDALSGGSILGNRNLSSYIDGTSVPPDGWTVTSSTWSASHVYFNTIPVISGSKCLQFHSGVVETQIIQSEPFSVTEGKLYTAGAIWQATANSILVPGLTLDIDWLDAGGTRIAAAQIFSLRPGNVSIYQQNIKTTKAPTGARYARLKFTVGSNSSSMDIFVDSVWVAEARTAFRVHKNGASQTGVGTGATKITFTSVASNGFDYGSDVDITTNSRFTAPEDGVYLLGACAQFQGVADQTDVFLYLSATSQTSQLFYLEGSGANKVLEAAGSAVLYMQAGQICEVWAQTTGAARTVGGGTDQTFFWGVRIA